MSNNVVGILCLCDEILQLRRYSVQIKEKLGLLFIVVRQRPTVVTPPLFFFSERERRKIQTTKKEFSGHRTLLYLNPVYIGIKVQFRSSLDTRIPVFVIVPSTYSKFLSFRDRYTVFVLILLHKNHVRKNHTIYNIPMEIRTHCLWMDDSRSQERLYFL